MIFTFIIIMEIKILNGVEQAHLATWVTVVIDVLRAFSTAVYLFERWITSITLVQTLEEAYALQKKDNTSILVGERGGLKPLWFTYGNSPTEIISTERRYLEGRHVIQTTSNWTRWFLLAHNASEIFTWSFVNANAIISQIQSLAPSVVSLLSTSPATAEQNEDLLLAEYLKSSLLWRPIYDIDYVAEVKKTSAYDYLFNQIQAPKKDFDLCMDLNAVDFVVRSEVQEGRSILSRHLVT